MQMLKIHAPARRTLSRTYLRHSIFMTFRQRTAADIQKRQYDSCGHVCLAVTRRQQCYYYPSYILGASNVELQRRTLGSTTGKQEHTGLSILSNKEVISDDSFQLDNNNPSFPGAEKEVIIPIDVKTLYDPKIHLSDKPDFNDPSLGYEVSTPLSEELIKVIALAGPISLAEYMKQALTHPDYGYYTRKVVHDDYYDDEDDDTSSYNNKSVSLIGKHGDFTTAPEVSQIFGESVLIWFIYQWKQTSMVNQKELTLIEIGPGKGTLMADILGSSLKSFPDFVEALCRGGGVHLVETSMPLRELQREAIQRAFDSANTGPIKLVFCDDNKGSTIKSNSANINDDNDNAVLYVQWHDILGSVPSTPKNGPQLFVAQEFIDALPVHSFQKTSEEGVWRERLVDVDAVDLDEFVSCKSTTAVNNTHHPVKKPRLRFILSPKVTPALRTLMKTDEFGRIEETRRMSDDAVDGDVLEVCPEGLSFVQDVSSRIHQCGGACLIIDYGSGRGTGDSVRAFKRHKQVPVLSLPGQVDITADVDFHALSKAVNQGSGGHQVKAYGPVNQGNYLASMGIVERVEQLIDDDETSEKQATDLYHALERLLLPDQMGERYQVLAIVKDDENNRNPPAGFQ